MMTRDISSELSESADVISRIDPDQIRAAAGIITEAFRRGNQAIFMGNGGSSADAQHISAELSGKYLFHRPALPGVCLSNIAPVTAVGNDYSYAEVFRRQIQAVCREGDAVVCYSTSGNSENIILAAEEARIRGAKIITFTGSGGRLKDMADAAVVIPSRETPRIQEAYLCASHIMCGIIEEEMFCNRAVFIDRDDTIAKNVPYCSNPDDFHLFEGVPENIARLNEAGFKVIIITNQSGIGRGYFSEDVLSSIHSKLLRLVEEKGGRIDGIYYCPHAPEDNCRCRKPGIGMGLRAVSEHSVNPFRSYMVGDSEADMEFGKNLGCKVFRVGNGKTFSDAVRFILGDQ